MKTAEICIIIACVIIIAYFTIHHIKESILQKRFIDSLKPGDVLRGIDDSHPTIIIHDKLSNDKIKVRKHGLVYIMSSKELNHKAYKVND